MAGQPEVNASFSVTAELHIIPIAPIQESNKEIGSIFISVQSFLPTKRLFLLKKLKLQRICYAAILRATCADSGGSDYHSRNSRAQGISRTDQRVRHAETPVVHGADGGGTARFGKGHPNQLLHREHVNCMARIHSIEFLSHFVARD